MIKVNFKPDPLRASYYVLKGIQDLGTESLNMGLSARAHGWRPPTDVYETETDLIVRVEVAGVIESDFSVIIDGRYLSIRGVRADVPEKRAYYQMEIRFGEFVTEVELPSQIVPDQIVAVYNNGFLRIVLPKARPQQVHIGIE